MNEPSPDPTNAPPTGTNEPESDDLVFDTLWGRVVEAWNEEKTHSAFVDYALRAQKLPEAVGRYKSLKDDPERGELAKKKMEAIALAATQMLFATKTPRDTKIPTSITLSAFAIALAIFGTLAYAMMRR
ncbi:MAG: hypothetical protein U0169_09640 [Polyangiaceae bacterium]